LLHHFRSGSCLVFRQCVTELVQPFLNGDYGVFMRHDGTHCYLLQTAKGDQKGQWNNFRPFYWNLSSGVVTIDGTGAGTYFNGDIFAAGNVTAFSDRRLKRDIEPIPDALDKLELLNGVTYTRIDDESQRRQIGLIAQDVLEAAPEAVMERNGMLSVAYGNLMGLAVEAIKELRREVETLRGEVQALKRSRA
ncbi:MAG: tail fiber domain-containing protein, partial [Burkholderia gladioli]